jgi:hypothetical protein
MFGNMSKVIDYINKNVATYNLNVKYSRVSDYMTAVYPINSTTTDFPKISGDFFPYGDNVNAIWTGYFVSRAELKNRGNVNLI